MRFEEAYVGWDSGRLTQAASLLGVCEMIHQDGSTHEWVPGQKWDLIVTMDDATSEHYLMFFAAKEGRISSLIGVREVIKPRELFSTFYSDRGSHYWHNPAARWTRRTPLNLVCANWGSK